MLVKACFAISVEGRLFQITVSLELPRPCLARLQARWLSVGSDPDLARNIWPLTSKVLTGWRGWERGLRRVEDVSVSLCLCCVLSLMNEIDISKNEYRLSKSSVEDRYAEPIPYFGVGRSGMESSGRRWICGCSSSRLGRQSPLCTSL